MRFERALILVWAFLNLTTAAQAPPLIEWQASFGGSGSDSLWKVLALKSGGFLLGGSSGSPPSGNKTAQDFGLTDFWVVRLNDEGEKLWDRSFGGIARETLLAIEETFEGGYVLAGGSGSAPSQREPEGLGGWVVWLNPEGEKIAERAFGGRGPGAGFLSLKQTSDGGFILGGVGDSSEPGFGNGDFWVVRLNSKRETVWERFFGGTKLDYLWEITLTRDGGFLLAGASESGISGNKTTDVFGWVDGWLVRLSAEGTKMWETCIGGNRTDIFQEAYEDTNGGIVIGGYSDSEVSGTKTSTDFGRGDYWFLLVDDNGQELSQKSFGSTNVDYLRSLKQTEDGGYLLGGRSHGTLGSRTAPMHGSGDYWLIRLNRSGDVIWDQAFGGAEGSSFFGSMALTPGGGILLGGSSSSGVSGNKTTATFGVYDYWVVKLGLDRPTLNISSRESILRWVERPGFLLEETRDLRGQNWVRVQKPVILNDNTNTLRFSINEIGDERRFFRLRKQ